MPSAEQFRVPPPPALTSHAYAAAFNEVQALGGDGVATPTERTDEQTLIGIYWAYDGTPSLCAPPRLYNQIALHDRRADAARTSSSSARLLALVNVAMADAGIAIWESKYYYEFWRPVTGIREADPGTGRPARATATPRRAATPNFTPLGAPASNLAGPELHAAVPRLSVGPRRLRRRAVPDAARLLRHRRHRRSRSSPTSSTA